MRTQRQFKPKNRSYANKGKRLEQIIELANNKYRNSNVADIRKVPTPFKVMKTYENGRSMGHFEAPDWVDYSGVYQGKAIIFDAKETSKGFFPMDKLATHQYNLLESWHNKGAVAFLVVHFTKEDKYYRLPFETLKWAWERAKNSPPRTKGAKSLSLVEFEQHATEIKSKDGYILHYLEAI